MVGLACGLGARALFVEGPVGCGIQASSASRDGRGVSGRASVGDRAQDGLDDGGQAGLARHWRIRIIRNDLAILSLAPPAAAPIDRIAALPEIDAADDKLR